MSKRVVIVESSELIAAGMSDVLSDSAHFKLVSTVSDIDALERRAPLDRPEMVIVGNPEAVNVQALRSIVSSDVVLVALVYRYVSSAQLRRFDAVIDVADSRGAIIETLIGASPAIDDNVDDNAGFELSRREIDVLVQVAKGSTNKEIAEALNLSVHTVISHRKNIMHKTGIKSVAGLTLYAVMNNLI